MPSALWHRGPITTSRSNSPVRVKSWRWTMATRLASNRFKRKSTTPSTVFAWWWFVPPADPAPSCSKPPRPLFIRPKRRLLPDRKTPATRGAAGVLLLQNYELLRNVDLCDLKFFFAIDLFDRAGGSYLFGGAAHVFMEGLGDVVIHQVIGVHFSILSFGLNHGLAFGRFLERAFGALGLPGNSLFLAFFCGKGRGSQRGQHKTRDDSCEQLGYFIHS